MGKAVEASQVDRGTRPLPLGALTHSQISRCKFRDARATNASSPFWERASGLSAAGSLRPRRLGRKGEGPDLGRFALREPIRHAPGPSPFLPKLASSLRQKALSQWGEEASRFRATASNG